MPVKREISGNVDRHAGELSFPCNFDYSADWPFKFKLLTSTLMEKRNHLACVDLFTGSQSTSACVMTSYFDTGTKSPFFWFLQRGVLVPIAKKIWLRNTPFWCL